MTEHTSPDRRRFLKGAAVAGGAVWVSPLILTAPAGAAPTVWYVEFDPNGAAVTTTSSGLVPPCEPAGWTPGVLPPVNGVDLNWTMTFNNGFDATQGFSLTFSDLGAQILGAEAEETCALSSPPGETRCVTGTIIGLDTVTFPDNFNPEQCLYDVFRIVLQTGS